MHASVGDDVFGEDPSINSLEDMAAKMFGMEASIFC
ncbi:MAG: beta-eliminating lyase-related protein, partial [Chitinophagaceae bacterium]|nr:beta-eliminating lyase-related protein [Chitinophagaceae bacterium]